LVSAAAAGSPDGSASDEVHKVYIISAHVQELKSWSTYQVVTEQLHDEGRVLVALLAQGIELCVANINVYSSYVTHKNTHQR